MKKISKKISMLIVKTAFAFAIFAVNTTCFHKYYQEEFDEQINSIRKY